MKVFDTFDTYACTLLDVAKQYSCMNVICKLVALHKSLCWLGLGSDWVTLAINGMLLRDFLHEEPTEEKE